MDSAKARLLVVDDSPFQRDFVAATLKEQGYEVATAENGVEALNKVFEVVPDLIISDVMMPELTGYQFCRIIKNDARTTDIPVILLTSLSQQQDKFWGRQAGADRFVVKDESIETIVETVEELIAEYREAERKPSIAPADEGISGSAAKSQLGNILEDLLFEATIANRVRDLFQHVADPSQLSSHLFEFMHEVFRFKLGALLVRSPRSVSLHLDLSPEIGHAGARELVWKEMGRHVPGIEEQSVQWHIRGGSKKSKVFPVLESRADVDIRVGEKMPGVVLLLDDGEESFGHDEAHTFKVIERELGALMSYMAARDETEAVKADFMSMIVHDLRSPLAGILAGADILKGGMAGEMSEDQLQVVEILASSSRRLMKLVNEVLDMSRIEAGRMSLNRSLSNPLEMVGRAVDENRFLAGEKSIDLSYDVADGLPSIDVDREKIEQVLINLLTNAIKFTPVEGAVKVVATADRGGVRFAVEDTGPGLTEAERGMLFTKYSELEGRKKAELKGTGLGLFICKNIVEAHQGTIGVDSTPGEGSSFHFTLPEQAHT